jgi:hypothetical protein
MRFFTLFLLILTVVAGYLSYHGLGTLTETVKLTYAYLALSTLASALIGLDMPRETPRRVAEQAIEPRV